MKKYFFSIILVLIFTSNDALSQRFYYGRNKIQYTDFDWMVLTTDHFNIYYYPEMKKLAEQGAFYAEESYKILENKFSHTITKKIPLIFYSAHLFFQQTNTTASFLPEGIGGFFEFFKGRVVIPSDGSTFRFKRVIHHELVHVFMHSKIYWVQKNEGKTRQVQPPLWFIEGLAELWSGEWDTQSEMVLVDQVLEGTLVPITSFGAIAGSYLMYKEGENFLRYIEKTYGEEKILMFMENITRGKKFEDVFKLVIGKGYAELNDEWVYSLKKQYYPLLENNEFPRMAAEKVTDRGLNEAPAYHRTEYGDFLYYISNTTGYTNIVKLSLKPGGQKPEIVIKGERTEQYEVIHFLSSKIDINEDGILAFSTKSGETDILYLYDTNANKLVDDFKFPGIITISSPSWSIDKSAIAFAGLNIAGNRDIYTLDIESGFLSQETDDFYDDKNPVWSPDGGSLVFSSSRTAYGEQGAYNLFVKELDTGEIYQITNGLHVDRSPVWSYEGNYLAYTSNRNGVANVFMTHMYEVLPSGNKGRTTTISFESGLGDENKDIGSEDLQNAAIFYEPGETKQVTNFTTGVFDPEFTPEGGLFFTAFERYSYQLRYLENALDIFEEKPILETDEITNDDSDWKPGEIDIVHDQNAGVYEKKYSLDIAQGQVTNDPLFGTNGGARFAISDLLGNDRYFLLLYNNSQTKENIFRSFNFTLMRSLLKKRINYNYGIFHFSGRRFNEADFFFNERYYGGFFGMSYPISLFERFDFSTNFGRSERDKLLDDQERIALLTGAYLSYVKDNSMWGPTGPLDGARYIVTLGKTKDISYNNVSYNTLIIDLRKYFRLSNSTALAVRLMTNINRGREAQRFYIGGSWDLRGYPLWQIWGQEINFLSVEYRFPFIDNFGIRFPFGRMGFGAIRGALFLDAARINDSGSEFTRLDGVEFPRKLGSVGIGFRFNLAGALVLRLDIGKRIQNNFSSISGKTFKQFFFGWDF
ncbi:PD40 domain-containing protein [candidate division KSB1 bacterium]|nr:PD40 domain-containing protein [candidate division KSB1 bacterium]